MNLRRHEFQIKEMTRTFMEKPDGKKGNEYKSLDEEAQLKLQISTLTAMNNELTVELKEQKNARRMLDGTFSFFFVWFCFLTIQNTLMENIRT